MDKEVKLKELRNKAAKYEQKLIDTRLKIGEADSPMQSQFPTGRFELEQDITVLEATLGQIKAEITVLEQELNKSSGK